MGKIKKHIVIAGILIMIIGFLYDALFAGIPPQDAPPLLMDDYNQQIKISEWIMKSGLLIFTIGIILTLIFYKRKNNTQ